MTELNKPAEAVNRRLHIARFIEDHKKVIFDKLHENYRRVRNQEQAPLLFVAQSLPLISGVIHVGATLEDYNRAKTWAEKELRATDPVAILSTLTLIYVVEKGAEEFAESDDFEKREVWTEMASSLQSLLSYA